MESPAYRFIHNAVERAIRRRDTQRRIHGIQQDPRLRSNTTRRQVYPDRDLFSGLTLSSKYSYLLLIPLFMLISFGADKYLVSKADSDLFEVQRWLTTRGFNHIPDARLLQRGIRSIYHLCSIDDDLILKLFHLPSQSRYAVQLKEELALLKQDLLLIQWLNQINLLDIYETLLSNDCRTIKAMHSTTCLSVGLKVLEKDKKRTQLFKTAVDNIKSGKSFHNILLIPESSYLLHFISLPWKMISLIVTILFYGFLFIAFVVIGSVIYRMLKRMQRSISGKYGEEIQLSSAMVGNYFDPLKTKLSFHWKEPCCVGKAVTMTIKFHKHNLFPFPISKLRSYKVEIIAMNEIIPINLLIGKQADSNSLTVEFTPKIAGAYAITVLVNGHLASRHQIIKKFLPGDVDPSKTRFDIPSNVILMRDGFQHTLQLKEHDKYDNLCIKSAERIVQYSLETVKLEDEEEEFHPDVSAVDNIIDITINGAGCYCLRVSFEDVLIQNGIITLVVLTGDQWKTVQNNAYKPSWTNLWYECYLLTDTSIHTNSGQLSPSINWNEVGKRKKVFCYVSSKLATVREYHFKFFFKTLFSMKLKPINKICVTAGKDPVTNLPCFIVERGLHGRVVFACQDRNVFIATFTQLVLNNIGGSYTFERKRSYFHSDLKLAYTVKSESRIKLLVSRSNILKTSMKQTKSFSANDWSKHFDVKFANEPGMDYGGVSREWFQLLSEALFDPKNLLFKTFQEDNRQALIHPNPHRPSAVNKISYFEFAGRLVGKALLECSHGKTRQQYIKARFSRSFLAQIIGLDVHWKHFESDDKDLYNGKIKYILENDPEDLEITFTDEVFNYDGTLLKTIELKPNGSKIDVNEDNKLEYLKLLAEYRLSLSVQREIEAFSKGLLDIIPEQLLSMFDENELELLICGMETISLADMKSNCTLAGTSAQFEKVMEWFWSIASGFNAEELSRLLQFTTGCSQLPPGGFSDLRPKFQFVAAPSIDSLPTAHTCFNSLCLPDYSSIAEFKKKLLLAISEGNEGFGFM